MKILGGYFSKQVWTAFAGFGLILGGVAWMVQILLLMKLIVKYGVEVGGFMGMSLYTFPMLVGIIMPFVIFISVIFVYNKMAENNEIAVCMANGLSPARIARPAIAIGLVVMAAHFAMNLFVLPKSQDMFYAAQWNLRYGLGHLKLKEATFNKMMDKVVIYVEEINQKDLRGVIMRDGRNQDEKIVSAAHGKLVNTQNGMSIVMGSGGFHVAGKAGVAIGTFDGAQMDMEMDGAEEGGARNARRASTPDLIEMLENLQGYSARNAAKIASEAATRFLTPLMDLVLVLIAVVFLLKTSTLRRRKSRAAAYGSLAMMVAETVFLSASVSSTNVNSLFYIGIGQIALIIGLLWYLRK